MNGFQRVQAPDGTILEFPAGMAEADMLAVMQRTYGGPSSPVAASQPGAEQIATMRGLAQGMARAGGSGGVSLDQQKAAALANARARLAEQAQGAPSPRPSPADISFDDLIPKPPGGAAAPNTNAAANLSFDDLIPSQNRPQAKTSGEGPWTRYQTPQPRTEGPWTRYQAGGAGNPPSEPPGLERLSSALVAADKAGDTAGARVLAKEIMRLREAGNPPSAPSTGKALGDMSTDELEAYIRQRREQEAGAMRTQAPNPYGFGSEVANSATFGFLDEITAGLMAPVEYGVENYIRGNPTTLSGAYDRVLSDVRGQQDQYRAENPIGSTAGAITGGVLTAGAAAPGILSRGAGLGSNMLRSGAAGAGMGAAAGFGEARGGFEERLSGAQGGAMLGGAFGAAAPAIGAGVGRVANSLASRAAKNQAAQQAGIPRASLDRIARAAGDDALDAAGIQRRFDQLGEFGMLSDLGPNLGEQAGAIASMPGGGRRALQEALEGRAAMAGDRIRSAADSNLGADPNLVDLAGDIIRRRSADARPLYDRAMSKPVAWDERLQQFIDDPTAKAGLARGIELQRLDALADGKPFNPTDYAITGFNEAGDPIISGVPNMRTLDSIKKGFDALVDDQRDALTGRLTERGVALDRVRRSFVDKLDSMNADYKAARKAWAGPTAVQKAIKDGRTLFRSNVSPDEISARVRDMSADELEGFQQGARAEISRIMGTNRNDAGAAIRELAEKEWNRDKLAAVFGDAEASRFWQALEAEKAFAATRNTVTGNSKSAARLAGQAEFSAGQRFADGASTALGAAAGALMGGGPGAALGAVAGRAGLSAVRSVAGAIANRGMTRAADGAADALSATGSMRDRIAQALMNREGGLQAAAGKSLNARMIAEILMRGTGVGTSNLGAR